MLTMSPFVVSQSYLRWTGPSAILRSKAASMPSRSPKTCTHLSRHRAHNRHINVNRQQHNHNHMHTQSAHRAAPASPPLPVLISAKPSSAAAWPWPFLPNFDFATPFDLAISCRPTGSPCIYQCACQCWQWLPLRWRGCTERWFYVTLCIYVTSCWHLTLLRYRVR